MSVRSEDRDPADDAEDAENVSLSVPADAAGTRLDAWLSGQLPDVTRSAVGRAIDAGRVRLDGAPPKKAGQKLRGGEVVVIRLEPSLDDVPPKPQDLPLDIVYRDRHLAVVDKPPGMVVHPAPGHRDGTLVNALLHHLGTDGLGDGGPVWRPGIVHRLDRDTSGLLVVARDDPTLVALQAQFKARRTRRRYLAVVAGPRIEDAGTRDTWYGRHPTDRKRMSSKVREGRRAVTHWRVLARSEAYALLIVGLETGRTHQIRVHLADIGHPIVADTLYGRKPPSGGGGRIGGELAAVRRMPRQALHAASLGFDHPATGDAMTFSARPPADLDVLVRRLFGEAATDAAMAAVAEASQPSPP